MSLDFSSLSDDDKSRIAVFLRTADKLRNGDLFKNGLFAMNYHLKVNAETGRVEERFERPPEKDVRDALLDIRKFIADSESISFFSMCNRIYQLLDDQTAKEHLASVREGFKNVLGGGKGASTARIGWRLKDTSEPKLLKPKEIIDLYFNSDYFHSDVDKIQQLKELKTGVGKILPYSFLEALRHIAGCVFYLAALIRREFNLPEELRG